MRSSLAVVATVASRVTAGSSPADIARGHANAWTCMPPEAVNPCRALINAIDGAWAVGDHGLVLRRVGDDWQRIARSRDADLTAIATIADDDVWVVGRTRLTSRGVMLHWNGVAWSSIAIPSVHGLDDIDMTSPTNGWAVGTMELGPPSALGGVVLRWDGQAWRVADTRPSSTTSVDAVGAKDVWVGGGGSMTQWDGVAWRAVPGPDGGISILGMVSSDYGWAVGRAGALFRWDGTAWHTEAAPRIGHRLIQAISMSGEDDGWAVGTDTVLRFDGHTWTPVDAPPGHHKSVVSLAPDSAWMITSNGRDDAILRWDGTSWAAVDTGRIRLRALTMLSESDGWVAGDGGLVLRWRPVPGRLAFLPFAGGR